MTGFPYTYGDNNDCEVVDDIANFTIKNLLPTLLVVLIGRAVPAFASTPATAPAPMPHHGKVVAVAIICMACGGAGSPAVVAAIKQNKKYALTHAATAICTWCACQAVNSVR